MTKIQILIVLKQPTLENALIDVGIAVSREQAVQMAQGIIAQRKTTPIKFLDDISNDILTPSQKEMLRTVSMVGSEETSMFHRSIARQINDRVLTLAREQKLETTAALVMQQVELLMQEQYVRPDQIDPLLEEFQKTKNQITNRNERNMLQQQYDYFALKAVFQKKQQSLSSQAEVDARQEAQNAVQDALSKIDTKSPYYVDAQLIKAQMMAQLGETKKADDIYQSIINKYPDFSAEATTKRLQLSTKQGESIDFLTQARPESFADQQQAIAILESVRDSIKNKGLSQKPAYLSDMMHELLTWYTTAQKSGLSDQMISEVLQTISQLNEYVAQLVSQNISNPDMAHDVMLWSSMQDTIISALTRLQSGITGTELAVIAPVVLDAELVNANGDYIGFVPAVAMLGDNLDLLAVDESGLLNDQLQQYKMQQLADFIALFAPDAQVSMVGDKIMLTGLSVQQVSIFTEMFTNGTTTALDQMVQSLSGQLEEWFTLLLQTINLLLISPNNGT